MTADLHDPLYERLVKILGALRVIESRRDTVEAEAEFLCRTFRSLPDGLSLKEVERELRSWVGLPPAPPAKRIERELQEFVREASKLRDRVSRMSKGAFDVMKVDRASIDLDGLIALEDAARWALSLRKQWEVGPRAKPRKLRAERVADAAASAFERLTGKPWTVPFNPETHKSYGPCLKFLEAVFTACGIDASAETYARAVTKTGRAKKMAKLQAELEAGRARYQALEAEVKASFKEKTPLKTFKRDK